MTAMRWIGLALLGILIAAAVAFAASRLASQQIGLASEPVTAGDALAPRAVEHANPTRHRAKHHPHRTQSSPTTPTPSESAEPPTYTTPPAPAKPQHSDGGDGEHSGGADD